MHHDLGKLQRLRQTGTLNSSPEKVRDELFVKRDFFDPNDLLQVRYEMVRRVRLQQATLAQAAHRFGVSRPTCFRGCKAFRIGGLQALIPAPRGPQGPHKITADVLAFVDHYRIAFGAISARRLAPLIEQEFGIRIHPRGLEKALRRRQKKLCAPRPDDVTRRTALRTVATDVAVRLQQPGDHRDEISWLVQGFDIECPAGASAAVGCGALECCGNPDLRCGDHRRGTVHPACTE